MLLAACYDQSTAENPLAALAPPAAETAVLHLAVEVGPGPGRSGHRGGGRLSRLAAGRAIGRGSAHWLPYVLIAAGWAPRGWRLLQVVVEGLADRPQHPRAQPQHEAALPDAVELPRRPDRRPAAARLATHRRPLRTADQAPGRAPLAALRRHPGAGRPRRRAVSDQRLDRPDAGAGLADAGQQVPQASRPGAEAACCRSSWSGSWTARAATSTSGPGWTSRT